MKVLFSFTLGEFFSRTINITAEPNEFHVTVLKLLYPANTRDRKAPVQNSSRVFPSQLADEGKAIRFPQVVLLIPIRLRPPSGIAFQVVVNEAVLPDQILSKIGFSG